MVSPNVLPDWESELLVGSVASGERERTSAEGTEGTCYPRLPATRAGGTEVGIQMWEMNG